MHELVKPSCNHYHKEDTHYCCHRYGYPLRSNYIEIKHKSHSRRHKEKSHVLYQKATERSYRIRFHHFSLQKNCKNEHAYYTRDKLTFTNEVTQNVVNDVCDIVSYKINGLSNKLMSILKELKADSEKFKVLGITFEEKAFFDVLVEVRDKHGFEYADERCIELAKKIKTLIDDTAVYADWLNNDNLKSKLASQLTYLLYKEGYPPQWDEEVFQKVLEQVENYKKHE